MVKDFIKKIPGTHYMYNRYIKYVKYNNTLLLYKTYKYHINRYRKYSGVAKSKGLITDIILLYHSIEKGFAMPNFRYGFGKEKLYKLAGLLELYISQGRDLDDSQFCSAISILSEYLDVHDKGNYILETKLKAKLIFLVEQFPNITKACIIQTTKDEFFSHNNAAFSFFSASRHSLRNFEGTIDISQIVSAIDLARNAPSACNRQPTRVHLITDKKMIEDCLALQNGNRGFGHLVDKLLIITGDLSSTTGYQEFADLYNNAGMFIMNLCYALHLNKVGNCILNWHVIPKNDLKLRKIANIPDNESIASLIACGGVPDKFALLTSPRRSTNEILTIH